MEAHRVLKENNFNVSLFHVGSDVFVNSRGYAAVMSAAAHKAAVTATHSRCDVCSQSRLQDIMIVLRIRQIGRAATTTLSNSLPDVLLWQLKWSHLFWTCPARPNSHL
jgi:hypothetical protein